MAARDPQLVDLEIKLGFLERTLEELNEVVIGQERRIEVLERQLEELRTRLAEKGEGGGEEGRELEDDRPPHY